MQHNPCLKLVARAVRPGLLLAALVLPGARVTAQPANLIAYWNFNDAGNPTQSVAQVGGYVGVFTNSLGTTANNPAYTVDGGGFTGLAGDRALNFGTDQSYRQMRSTDVAATLNAVAATDVLTVTFRQRYTGTVGSSSSFYFVSPSSGCNWRGFQGHMPWSGTTVYFDTVGCSGAAQRLSGGVGVNYQGWRLFQLVKNGGAKQVIVDGNVMLQQASGASPLPTDFTEILVGAAYVVGSPAPGVASNVRGLIDDFAIWQGTLTAAQTRLLLRGMTPDQVGVDSDNDGLPDGWEDLYLLDKNDPADAALDSDTDGSNNLQEYERDTHPRNPDTDSDGFLDGVETKTGVWTSPTDTGTDPLNPDTDQDLLLDGVESNTLVYVNPTNTGTDPNKWDSDFDGFGDGAEVALGSSPVDNSTPSVGTGARILAYWDFNNASAPTQAVDSVHNLLAYFPNGVTTLTNGQLAITNGVVYTADSGGRTGQPGDRAADFGTNAFQRVIRSRAVAPYLQAASAFDPVSGRQDTISLSFWQKWTVPPVGNSVFWLVSPSVGAATQYRGCRRTTPTASVSRFTSTRPGAALWARSGPSAPPPPASTGSSGTTLSSSRTAPRSKSGLMACCSRIRSAPCRCRPTSPNWCWAPTIPIWARSSVDCSTRSRSTAAA
jgi:hypothetical protein